MKKLFSAALLALVSTVAFATTTVPIQLLSPIAANTVLANATGSSAAPTAFAMPSCTATSSALNYTPGSGWFCNGSINASVLLGFNWAVPGALGTTTPNSAAFTTLSTTGLSSLLNTASGAQVIKLTGNGATTPNKYLGVLNGLFTIYSSSGSTLLASLDETGPGNLVIAGSLTPSQTGGIVGTTTNNNANAGSIGEYPSSTNLTNVSLTTVTPANTASMSLTAGDWEVECITQFNIGTGGTLTLSEVGVSATSATFGAFQQNQSIGGLSATAASVGNIVLTSPVARFQPTTTTTYYCVGEAAFSGGAVTANGFIRARRPR